MRDAAVFARAAVVAWLAAVERLGQDRGAADGDIAIETGVDLVLEMLLATGHRHRRLHDAVGELHQAERFAADADIALDGLVVRDHFLVCHRPVLAVAVVAGG